MVRTSKSWPVYLLGLLLTACAVPPKPLPVLPAQPVAALTSSRWEQLPDWHLQDLTASWPAFLQSCRVLRSKLVWQSPCARAMRLDATDNQALRTFYEEEFTPYQVNNPDGSTRGLITGYYEPKLLGSRTRSERFRYPLYAVPDDLLQIDLGAAYPQLKDLRLRGRVQGKRVVPYYKRAEIDAGTESLKGRELFWVEDAVELFFLQIQGSGRIELPDGSLVKIGYADQNGFPYVSVGKKLVEMGEIKLEQASMQGIIAWAVRHPDKLDALLQQNPSYVFFRELPDNLSAPLGALGVPLTEEYSLAVDARTIPLGAPVFLSTTQPNSTLPLNRLMLAQDTGGAIKGAVRADFFWGFGERAAEQAGSMKQQGRMWLLFPATAPPTTN